MARLTMLAPAGLPEVERGCDLAQLVLDACSGEHWAIEPGDCFVLAQKIVSKATGRDVFLDEVVPSAEARELAATTRKDAALVHLILSESVRVVRAIPELLITEHRLGHVLANAGVDQSNVPDKDGRARALLLPLDPDACARDVALALQARTGHAVAVVINDSFGRPWREGVVGTAIGAYGVPALIDRRGQPDRDNRPMQVTRIAHADEIAAAASLLMGQAAEGRPLVCIRGLAMDVSATGMAAIHRPAKQDLFR